MKTEPKTDEPAPAHEAEQVEAATPVAPDASLDAGINHLRTMDAGALRLWTVKGPKGMGESTISAVLMDQDTTPRIVMLHQQSGGRFAVFEKVAT